MSSAVSSSVGQMFISTAASFAVSYLASTILTKLNGPTSESDQRNPGNRQQVPPAGDNKLPVIYGDAYVGGIVTDMTISGSNQTIYYVMSLAEVTNTEAGVSVGGPDEITFGKIYWGGKLCIFDTVDKTKVVALLDETTNKRDTTISGYLFFSLYKNGSYEPVNTTKSAIEVMSVPVGATTGLIYKWNSTKLMTNTAFAIIRLIYSTAASTTGLVQTKFQLTNSRKSPGDCFYDYLTSTRYGAAISPSLIDTASLTDLNNYSNAFINYTSYDGKVYSQKRYQFNGLIDTNQKIMQNIQSMSDCCNCLVKYNEIYGTWGVIVQKPSTTVAMDLNDSNIVSSITVSPIDTSNTFNVIQVNYPEVTTQDAFSAATFDLAVLNPSLMYPNEPVNKQDVNLYLVNNNITAQYLANIFLEGARENLQVILEVDYTGLQLEAGDVVSITNVNYGWDHKLFRINRAVQKFSADAQITIQLTLSEYNPAIYDDKNVTQFEPLDDTGLGSPLDWNDVPTPVINTIAPSAAVPYFTVDITSSSGGTVQYAELWYSAFANPTIDQLIFYGTTEINSNGTPYLNDTLLPTITVTGLPAGDWYMFSRMVNTLGSSQYSDASDVLTWRPTTFQYTLRYNSVAYADDINGTGFTFSRLNKAYFGIYNSNSSTAPSDPALYKWYSVYTTSNGTFTDFGTDKYLIYANRGNRVISYNVDYATTVSGNKLIPTSTFDFDSKTWQALADV